MSDQLLYQVRIYLSDAFAETARGDPGDPALAPLAAILARHGATIKCHFDAFAEYVAEAEKQGVEQFPLYRWTKATIEDPEKKTKHLKIFTIHVGEDAVYAKPVADALEADLQPIAGGEIVTRVSKHDTNPANNPQMPEQFRP